MNVGSIATMIAVTALMQSLSHPAPASDPVLPDHKITPGATLNVTKEDICQSGYTRRVRDVKESRKLEVYSAYNVQAHTGKYEIDHLISLELGGSNDITNLWPQSYFTYPWNAKIKDRLENKLHDMVCNGVIPLEQAQEEVSTDWIKAYCKYFDDATESCPTYMKGLQK